MFLSSPSNFHFSWLQLFVCAVLLIAAKYVYRRARVSYLSRKWKTESPPWIHNSLYGLLKLRKVRELRQSGYFPDHQKKQFDDMHVETFQQKVFNQKLIFTASPLNIKALLLTQFDDYSIGPRSPAFRPLLGNGVFAADEEHWKISRSMLRPQFSREQVGHVKALEPHFMTLVKHIEKHGGREFDIQPLFQALTLDASTEFLLGESVHFLRDELIGYDSADYAMAGKQEFNRAIKQVSEYISLRVSYFWLYFLLNSAEFRQSVKDVHKFAMNFVQKALAMSPEELEHKTKNSYTILYELVKVSRDPVLVRDQMLNVMLAGRSTTASLLASIFFELSRHPEVWQKLREEVIGHFGEGTPEDLQKITFESLKRCTYLKWVINETLRLYPPVANNFRQAKHDTSLPTGGGELGKERIFVEKGQIIVFHIYTCQRLQNYFGKDAEKYRPERWADLTKIGWAFMPFGSGPRVCLGQQFALTEASYVTARLAQLFSRIHCHSDNYPPRKTPNATMQHMDGVRVSFE